MVLYKYVDLDTAEKILRNGTLGFSKFSSFNDPFETLTLGNSEQPDFFNALPTRINERYVAACLTRSKSNSLMWSHYADQHNGVVIGYDVDCLELRSNEQNLIPVQLGSVIYSRTMPSMVLDLPQGFGDSFNSDNYEALQHVFLMKADDWFYEEEVRIVRALVEDPYNPEQFALELSNAESLKPLDEERNTYILQMPQKSIKEVILGCRVNRNDPALLRLFEYALKHNQEMYFGRCSLIPGTWRVTISNINLNSDYGVRRYSEGNEEISQEEIPLL